jgi:hypothetical protein
LGLILLLFPSSLILFSSVWFLTSNSIENMQRGFQHTCTTLCGVNTGVLLCSLLLLFFIFIWQFWEFFVVLSRFFSFSLARVWDWLIFFCSFLVCFL